MGLTMASNSNNTTNSGRGAISFRTRLILSTMLIAFLAVAGMGLYVFYRAQQTDTYLTQQLDATVRQQAESNLQNASIVEVQSLNDFFLSLRKEITTLSGTSGKLLENEAVLNTGAYWDALKSLSRLSNGSWDNSNQDPFSIFIPGTTILGDSLISEINTLVQQNFNITEILRTNPDVVAFYFGGTKGQTLYYPNVDLAALVPPDFDVTQRPWFTNATQGTNPSRTAVWSAPYLDAASNGLIITVSAPVYDAAGIFRGVDAMDIQLNKITEIVSNFKIGETGHAFLIDKEMRLIAMPDAAYADFGITPENYPLGSVIDKDVPTKKSSPELLVVVDRMSRGLSGIETLNINGVENFIVYSPVPEVGYSLAIVVPSQELLSGATEARAQIAQSTQQSLLLGGLLVAIVLILTFLAALFIGNRLQKPIKDLTNVAEEITKGNLNVESKVTGQDEIGVLATAFNSMTVRLRESIGALEQRVAARTEDLATVADVSTATATILDTQRLLQSVVDLTKERFYNLYHAHIYLLDEAGENLVLAAGAGEAGRQMVAEKRSISIHLEQSLVARAAREQKGVIANDVTKAPDFLPNPYLPDTRSELAVPMMVGGKLIGVFDVQSDQVDRFNESDVNIQTTLAAQVATSIQNARLFEQSKSRADVEALTVAIGEKIQRASSVEDALQTAIREIGVALGAARVRANITATRGTEEDSRELPAA